MLSKKHRKQLEKVIERKKKKLQVFFLLCIKDKKIKCTIIEKYIFIILYATQRATLLEDLVKLQASSDELQQYTSLTSLQSKGLKRHFRELEIPISKLKRKRNEIKKSDTIDATFCANSIKGSKKKRLVILDHAKQNKTIFDSNIVGLEVSLKQLSVKNCQNCDRSNKIVFI